MLCELILWCTFGLWITSGVFVGQKKYRELRDVDGRKPYPALMLAIGFGIISPPWLAAKGVWILVKGGFILKK